MNSRSSRLCIHDHFTHNTTQRNTFIITERLTQHQIKMLRVFLVVFVIIHVTQQQQQEEEQQKSDCRVDFHATICKNINFDNDDGRNLLKTTKIETNRLEIEASSGNALNFENFQLDQSSKERINELILTNNNFKTINTNTLCTTFENLQQLQLANNRELLKIDREQFKNCDQLKQLYLDNVIIIDEIFTKLPNLETLTITNSKFNNNSSLILTNLDRLKSLTIRYTNIKDYLNNNSAIFNKQLINLQYLDLQHNHLDYLPIIDDWKNLEILDLSYNEFNNTIWQYLNKNPTSLKVLFLDHNNINDIVDIEKLLMNHQQLERMFLSGRKFRAEKIKEIDNELTNKTLVAERKLNLIWLDD